MLPCIIKLLHFGTPLTFYPPPPLIILNCINLLEQCFNIHGTHATAIARAEYIINAPWTPNNFEVIEYHQSDGTTLTTIPDDPNQGHPKNIVAVHCQCNFDFFPENVPGDRFASDAHYFASN